LHLRFGFNGKEHDSEAKGWQNQIDYGMRVYDPRLGRFLSVDPLASAYPWNSTYSFSENDPINFIDLDGAEKGDPPYKKNNVYFIQLFNPWISPVLRKDWEAFTVTACHLNTDDLVEYTINGQMFKGSWFGFTWPYKNSSFTPIGKTVYEGKHVTGSSSPQTFSFSIKDGVVSFGQGDPREDADFGIGGGVPVIINRMPYGATNVFSEDAPRGLNERGDPGKNLRRFLTQRSNAAFEEQDKIEKGKTIVAYNSKTEAFMLVVQPSGKQGMSLSQIRDYLISLGYDNAISLDGGTSSALVADDRLLVNPNGFKDNGIPSGLMFRVLPNKNEDQKEE